MERLTKRRIDDGEAYLACVELREDECDGQCTICWRAGDAVDRLAAYEDAYEDTGFSPEEIKSAFTPDSSIKLAAQALGTTPDELRGMAKARKDGRLAILPTARGDMLTSEEVSAAQPFFDDVDVSVHYCTSNGMMIFVGYDAFRDWVKNWEIAAANKEAERAMQEMGGKKDG